MLVSILSITTIAIRITKLLFYSQSMSTYLGRWESQLTMSYNERKESETQPAPPLDLLPWPLGCYWWWRCCLMSASCVVLLSLFSCRRIPARNYQPYFVWLYLLQFKQWFNSFAIAAGRLTLIYNAETVNNFCLPSTVLNSKKQVLMKWLQTDDYGKWKMRRSEEFSSTGSISSS